MASGSFDERIAHLAAAVGTGKLTGRVVVDQRYAEVQERREDYRHPRGGQARYLQAAVVGGNQDYMRRLADRAVTKDGSDAVDAMRDNVEDASRGVTGLAPVDRNNLRRSAAPSVDDEGATVYSRPPAQRRLSDAELRRRSPGRARPRRRRRR